MLTRGPRIQLFSALGRPFDDGADFSHERFYSRFREILGDRITDRISLVLREPSELVELVFSPCEGAGDARLERRSKRLPDLCATIIICDCSSNGGRSPLGSPRWEYG